MTSRSERIAELTSELVAAPSHETEADVQRILSERLTNVGFDCRLTEVAPQRPNLVAVRGEGGVFLCSHADTHPPHGHPEPFTCRRRGELLVGRGVVDTKGLMAAMVVALEEDTEAPAVIAITCDEEFGGKGSEQIQVPDGPWFSDGGVVLEPTEFRICTAQTGHIDISVEVSGDPQHVYAAETSGSPISAVLAAADALETCSFLSARHPLLEPTRTHVGRIGGGEHPWRKPGRASMQLTIGVLPGVDMDAAVAEVRERMDDVAQRWGARNTSFLYDVTDSSPPIEVPGDLPIAERLRTALGEAAEPSGMPSWTDAGNLLLRHGLPCVVFGAGELGPAHSNDEWVRLPDLDRLAGVLQELLKSSVTLE
ncbi:MAG TPA: M20/M25/M40 family metallo-hydrolase [Actinomycetota bacterium]|nr:M20/M25/M40 family metallo-hydrolase [Actinomycetota bacterium]